MSDGSLAQAGRFARVLVVGDSPRTRRALEALERGIGPDAVATAATVDEAIDRLDGTDCVVCDVDNRDDSGLIRRLRDRTDAPILALAADDEAAAIRAGADDVVSPAAPADVFLARLRNVTAVDSIAEGEPAPGWFRAIVGATSAAIAVATPDGRIGWASPAVLRSTGFTPAEIEGDALARLFHPDDRGSVRDAVDGAAADGLDAERRVDCRVRLADGRWARAELVVVNRLADPAIEGLVCTIERGVAEPTSTVVDTIDDPVFALADDWSIAASNEAARDLLDATDDPRGLVLWELLPESTVSEWFERLSEAAARNEPLQFEVDDPTGPGFLEVRVYPDEGTLAVLASRRRESASQRYRERLADLSSLLDAVDGPAFLVEDGRVAVANAAAFEYTDEDVVVGRELSSVVGAALADRIAERATSPVRRLDPIEWTVETPEGRRAVEFSVVPLGDGRAACVGVDVTGRVRLERAASAVATALDDCRGAETPGDVRRAIVAGLRDALAVPHAIWYRRENGRLTPLVAASERSDLDPPPLEWPSRDALADGRTIVADRSERFPVGDGVTVAGPLVVPVDDESVVIAGGEDASVVDTDRVAGHLAGRAAAFALAVVEGAAERRELERELARHRERAGALSALLDRRRAVDRRLLEAEGRDAIERGVCEELCELDDVALAWIAEVAGGDALAVRASAGDATAYPSALAEGSTPHPSEPAALALTRRSPQVVDDVDSTAVSESWRTLAARHGLRSAVAMPIEVGGLQYGALAVYARRPSAFDDPTTDVLADAAATTALAIDAHEARRALLADDVIELEFALDAVEEPGVLSTLAERTGGDVEVETVAPGRDGSTIYLTVRGAGVDDALAALSDHDRVTSVTRLRDVGEAVRLEVVVDGRTLPEVAVEHGGVMRSVTADETSTRAVVDLPAGRNVRAFVRALRESVPGVELLARRTTRRPPDAIRTGRADPLSGLTDRQLEVLRTAHAAGYFEWPRERTGEEVAERLGISQPTFTRHFRAAERTVFEALFGDRRGPGPSV